MKNSIPIVN